MVIGDARAAFATLPDGEGGEGRGREEEGEGAGADQSECITPSLLIFAIRDPTIG